MKDTYEQFQCIQNEPGIYSDSTPSDHSYQEAVKSGKMGLLIVLTISLGTCHQSEIKPQIISRLIKQGLHLPDQSAPQNKIYSWTVAGLKAKYNKTKSYIVVSYRGELVASSGTSRPCFHYGPWWNIIEDVYLGILEAQMQASLCHRRQDSCI